MDNALNGYVCFYNGKRVEVEATTTYAAQQKVAELLKVKPKKQYMITVTLAERAGERGQPVIHTAVD